MLLTNKISALDGVNKVSIMMATPANKDMYKAGGMETEELLNASANDMVIVADVADAAMMDTIMEETEEFLRNQATTSNGSDENEAVRSWDKAMEKNSGANMALLSIPGVYAAAEADRALDEGMNVFMFSDNVTIEDEKRLKEKAHKKGLVLMGPDCGTGIVQGVPMAFTNSVSKGKIGIVGASGTGIQELTTIIDRMGEGVTNALGTGGRDLSTTVGGITMLDCINAMDKDDNTDVLIVISKPPAKEVRDKIYARLTKCTKPVVTLFLGEKPKYHEKDFYHAYTLDEAARTAVQLIRGEEVKLIKAELPGGVFFDKKDNKSIKAYYSGGTLAGEAAMLIKESLDLKINPEKAEGFMLKTGGHIVVDLGDDVYTQGKPHPMIDPTKRAECMREACDDPSTGVILLDVVLGYGSHEDMAGALLPAIKDLQKKAADENRKLFFLATVCGTRSDFQNYDEQVRKLKEANVYVCESNKIAVEAAIKMIGRTIEESEKEVREVQAVDCEIEEPSAALMQMISEKPVTLNIGLKSFAKVIKDYNCKVLQFDWAPPAGGDVEMIKTLQFLRNFEF